jgi:hypothetical protein
MGLPGPTGTEGPTGPTGDIGVTGPTGSASSVISGTAGESLNQYDVVYSDSSSGNFKKAVCSGTLAQADALGIVIQDGGISSGSSGNILLGGDVTNGSWSWVTGGELFLSNSSGGITQTKPTTVGYYVKPLGFAKTTGSIWFYPNLGWKIYADPNTILGAYYKNVVGGRLERTSDTVLTWSYFLSDSIGLFDGSVWIIVTPSTNPTLSNTATDLNGVTLTYDKNYDIFAQYSSGTAFTLVAKQWSGDTSRGYTLYRKDGIYVYDSSADGVKRRWLGTIRLRNNGGVASFTDQKDKRFINNFYNKQRKTFGKSNPYSSNTSIATSTSAWRRWNNNTDWLIEIVSDGINAIRLSSNLYMEAGTAGAAPFGLDSTSTVASDCGIGRSNFTGNRIQNWESILTEGYHYIYPLSGGTSGNEYYYYTSGVIDAIRSTVDGSCFC